MKARAAVALTAIIGVLLTGCASGQGESSAGAVFTANPRLSAVTTGQPTSTTAIGVAQAIAVRWAAAKNPVVTPHTPIEFRETDYSASISDPGSPDGFTAFLTTRRTTIVAPSSAAIAYIINYAAPRFATSTEQAVRKADGSPSLGQPPANGQRISFPAGQFSFLPQGSTLTYRQVTLLPGDPQEFAATILGHLRAYAGAHPPASLQLKQLGYLLATAPMSN